MNIVKINNIAELKTRRGSEGAVVEVLGYSTLGDGEGGTFYWNNLSVEADDGNLIIAVTGVSTGRWKKIVSDLSLKGGVLTGNLTLSSSNINTKRVATYGDLIALSALSNYIGLVLVNSDSTNGNIATIYLVYNNLVFWIPSQSN